MNVNWNARRTLIALSLSGALLIAGCCSSPPTPPAPPVVPKQLKIPSPPAISEPPTSLALWKKHCGLTQSAQERLKTSLAMSERCSELGQPPAQPK